MAGPVPLRRFVLIQITSATILPVVVIAMLIWWIMVPQLRTSISLQHQSLARSIAGEILAHLMGGERQLVTLADVLVGEETYSASQLTAFLDAGCGEGDLFETIYIVKGEDKTIGNIGLARASRSRRDDLLGIDISGHKVYKIALQELRTVWSETFLSTVSSHLAVALAVPLPARAIVGEITLDNLSEFISQLPVETGLLTMVLDRQGRIVADSQQERWGEQLELAALPASGSKSSTASVSQPFDLDGVHMVGSMVDVERMGWKVLVAQPYAMAFKPLQSVFLMMASGLAFALMVALAVAWIQSKRLGSLVLFYTGQAKSIAGGEYDLQWPPAKTLEYQELGENLRSMAQRIRQREQQLLASETHMRITLDSIGDGVIVTDTEGAITRLNPVAEKLTGWSSREAAGRPLSEIFQIVNSRTGQAVENPVDEVLSSGRIVGLANPTRLIARNGEEYQIADSRAPIRHADGRMAGVVLVFRDVGETYARERKLRESERRLRKLTDNVPGVVIQFRATRDHIYTNEFLSAKTAEIFGLDPDSETIFKDFYLHIPDAEKKAYTDSLHTAVETGAPWAYEGHFIRPDGETIWFSGHAVPHNEGDTLVFCGVLLDISDRKRMEDVLRESEERYRTIHDASFGGIFIHEQGIVLECNQGLSEITGYTLDELIGMDALNTLVAPDSRVTVREKIASGYGQPYDAEGVRKDGTIYPLNIQGKNIPYRGRIVRAVEYRDITEKKLAEETLQQNYFQLKAIYNTLPVIIWSLDENGIFTLSEGRELETIGMQSGDVVGMSVFDLYKDNPLIIEKTKTALKGQFCEYETEVSGAIFHSFLTPFYNENNMVCGLHGIAINITEKKLAETELRNLRNYLNNIINSMPSAIVGVDTRGRVTQWNRQAEQITGRLSHQVVAKPLSSVFAELTDQMADIRTAIKERRVITSPKIARKLEQETRYEDVTIFPLVTNGVEGAVIRVDDVTERVRLEEMLVQNEKMLSIGGLAAGMAHEINNPLAGILQNAAVLSNRLFMDLPANRKAADTAGITLAAMRHYLELRKLPEMIDNINNSGLRATAIVKNMLGFARKGDRSVSSHDLGTLLDLTIELVEADYDMKKNYDFKKIRIIREYDEAGTEVPCEAGKIQQVFMNLLKNGAEAMAGVGATAMAEENQGPPMFTLRTKADGNWVQVEIEDNGPGMDEKTRRSIFEPFFTTKPVGKGTGLGLSVSYFIITEDHGGKMEVRAPESGGARFVIRLPR